MPLDHQQGVREAFPELTEIRDGDIREGVVAAWSKGLAESSFEELGEVPWWPPYEHEMGRSISGVRHIRDVTQLALEIADTVDRRFNADVVTVSASSTRGVLGVTNPSYAAFVISGIRTRSGTSSVGDVSWMPCSHSLVCRTSICPSAFVPCSATSRSSTRRPADFNDLIPHPHYAVHVIARAGLSVELQHIALAHTSQTSVEPVTMEARIVQLADQLALDGLLYEHTGNLAGHGIGEDSDDSDE